MHIPLAFVSFAALAACGTLASPRPPYKVNIMDVIEVKSAGCEDCGMGVFGSITVTICKSPGECCTTGELHSFKRDQKSYFTSDDLEECFGFEMGSKADLTDVSVEIQHHASDEGAFEWVRALTNQGYYQCQFDPNQMMQGDDKQNSINCHFEQ